MMFNNLSPTVDSMGINGGMGYPVPPNPIVSIGGVGYNQPIQTTGYNPYLTQASQPQVNMQSTYQPTQIGYTSPLMVGGNGMPITGQYMPYQQFSQPQPMVGSYYTGAGYYAANPYLIQRQMEIQRLQEEELEKQQAGLMKMISKNVNSYLGVEVDEDFLKQYDPVYKDPKEIKCEQNWSRMVHLEQLSQSPNKVQTRVYTINQNNNIRIAKMKERYPDDMTLFEFLEIAGELYNEAITSKIQQQEQQVNRLYQQSSYSNLLNIHNNGSYYNKIMNFQPDDISVDDLEVTLPENLARTYDQRRADFFKAILG